jgi:3-isopropylmalate/(R)-2-methylmalate dehydratase large subunit
MGGMKLPQTLSEKIIARAAGLSTVSPGQIVGVSVDRMMINDRMAPIVFDYFKSLCVESVVNPERILISVDHRVPPATVALADTLRDIRSFCKNHGLAGFGEIGRHGIGHQIMCEDFTHPGEIAVGTDSHAPMYGGLGALACGINASDAAVVMATGKMWMCVPESVRVLFEGTLNRGTTAKDIALFMQNLDDTENFIYRDLEIGGAGALALSVSGRLVISNMAAEMEAKACIFVPDEKVAEYLGDGLGCDLRSDSDAVYERTYTIDIAKIEPLLACPHSLRNIRPVRELRGLPIQQAFLGSCTNGRLEDLIQAAEILEGRAVHPDVRLIVVPASQKVFTEATALGVTETLLRAGAAFITPSCASCAGSGPGLIGGGERCVSTTNRNFRGRMGSPDSEVYLASAYTVAAAAVAGCVESPERFLEGGNA